MKYYKDGDNSLNLCQEFGIYLCACEWRCTASEPYEPTISAAAGHLAQTKKSICARPVDF